MNKYEVINKDRNSYQLKKVATDNIVNCMINLYKIEGLQPKDVIIIDERLLDINYKYYVQPYSYELSHDKLKKEELNGNDYIILIRNNKKYLMKRIYG